MNLKMRSLYRQIQKYADCPIPKIENVNMKKKLILILSKQSSTGKKTFISLEPYIWQGKLYQCDTNWS